MHKYLKNFAYDFSENSILRGIGLYDDNSVYSVRKKGNSYYFSVDGLTDSYETVISFDEDNEVEYCHCTCPHFASGKLCKHLYASLLKLDDIFEGRDKSLIIESEQTNVINNKPQESKENESTNNSNIKKSKMSNDDLAQFRIYCNSYDVDLTQMNSFLDKFELNSHDLAMLFSILRKTKPMEIFLNHFENKLDSEFFKEIDLASFPLSTPFKALIPFLLGHGDMLQYLNYSSLTEIFSHHRVPQLQDRITLLFLCLNLNFKEAISIFFADSENVLNFFQMNSLINYMKTNMTKEEILVALDNRIKSKEISRMESAFLYPYFSEEIKTDYDNFFKKNYVAHLNVESYYSYYDYEHEFYYGLPLNRTFYDLLKNQSTNSLLGYDIKILYYLRDKVFTSKDNLIFAKRFKQLAASLFRSKNPDLTKLYCSLAIILEYGDNNTIIKSLEPKAISYFSNLFNIYNCKYIELIELFYKLSLKSGSKEDRSISNYNKGA